MSKQVTVLGAGSWGTALAHHLQTAGNQVTLWARDEALLKGIAEKGTNPRYLKDLPLSTGLRTEADISIAAADSSLLVVAVPSSAMREVVRKVSSSLLPDVLVVSGIKGFESETLKTPSQVIGEELGASERVAALGGPSFAAELVQGFPTAVTLAAGNAQVANAIQSYFHFGNVRVYTSEDVIGVEVAGALKNVIALATGIIDGVGMGHNARAALITRGLVELQALAVAMGADPRTIAGLSGLGDLLLTSVGDLSRNRQVGLRLGRGEQLEKITKDLGQVAEGVKSTRLAMQLAERHGIDMPIVEQTDALLSGRTTVDQAVQALLAREPKSEVR